MATEIEYTADVHFDNENIKPEYRGFEYVYPQYMINANPFVKGNYVSVESSQPINEVLPEWACATHITEIGIDGYGSTFAVNADDIETLQCRIWILKNQLLINPSA